AAPGPLVELYPADFSRPSSPRIAFIDVARVAAILFMIQGHTLDVLLAPAHREGPIFVSWLFLRGLTAPLFFVLSGASFTISTLRYWDNSSRASFKTLRRIARFAFFVLLGYAMHLPANTIGDFQYVTASGWQNWFQVDVLQCIGLSLIALQLVVMLSRTQHN